MKEWLLRRERREEREEKRASHVIRADHVIQTPDALMAAVFYDRYMTAITFNFIDPDIVSLHSYQYQ